MIQISTADLRCYIIREPNEYSRWLQALLLHGYATKIFHHALFDLRFIKRWMAIDIAGQVECTKTLHKMIHPGVKAGLAHLVKSRYGISLPHMGTYNWDGKLTAKQKEYVVGDVLYLHTLVRDLKREASHGQLARYRMAMRTIRNKATLEVEGYEDTLDYPIGDKDRLENIRAIWAIMKQRTGPLTQLSNPE